MAIGRTFEESLLKAIDSLDIGLNYHLGMEKISTWTDEEILSSLKNPNDERIFVLSEALIRGYSIERIVELTSIDKFFVNKLNNIVKLSQLLKEKTIDTLNYRTLYKCKKYGFSDSYIANILNTAEDRVAQLREQHNLKAVYLSLIHIFSYI